MLSLATRGQTPRTPRTSKPSQIEQNKKFSSVHQLNVSRSDPHGHEEAKSGLTAQSWTRSRRLHNAVPHKLNLFKCMLWGIETTLATWLLSKAKHKRKNQESWSQRCEKAEWKLNCINKQACFVIHSPVNQTNVKITMFWCHSAQWIHDVSHRPLKEHTRFWFWF